MKALKSVTVAAFLVVAVASCKKQATAISAPASSKAGKKFTQVDYMYQNVLDNASKYVYDNAGRISSNIEADYTDYFDHQSASKLVVTRKSNTDNSIMRTYEATLNEKGFVTSMISKDKTGAVIETTTITYNSEGYLIKHTTQGIGSSYGREYVIENGKIITGKKFNNGVQTGNEVFTVDMSKENKQSFTAWGYWHSHNLFGKPLKYLIVESKEFDAAGTLKWHRKNNYERDADGDVTKISTQFISEAATGITTYKY
ncbi:MAG: hypothetical protein GXC73_18945 [Chitinophagaceae bacterium]|nr:hypothetical protein [Chitinophagaceae bacterium]